MIGHMMQEHGSASGSSQIASPNRATNQLPSPAQSYERDNPTPLGNFYSSIIDRMFASFD